MTRLPRLCCKESLALRSPPWAPSLGKLAAESMPATEKRHSFAALASAAASESAFIWQGRSPVSCILVIDDDRAVLHIFKQLFQQDGAELLTARSAVEGLQLVRERAPEVVILDIMLPDRSGLDALAEIRQLDVKIPVILITAGGTSDTAIEAMKSGAYDYLVKPLDLAVVRKLVDEAVSAARLMRVAVNVPTAAATSSAPADAFLGRSEAMQQVFKSIGRVAPHDVTVLIRGENGTGKELVARAIYHHSHRAAGKFMAVNIAAVPDTLLESELFGHEKGAFTGAEGRRIGRFEQCSGGTLFLDEIGDLPAQAQSKLLRLLQEQQFERVGGSETIQTNVRIVAATNRDLEKMVADGDFRSDLYYRLNGYTITLPPLRERRDDIPLLANDFVARFSAQLEKNVESISPEALELLQTYSWPGNVRELQSAVRQALLNSTGRLLLPQSLPEEIRRAVKSSAPPSGGLADLEAYISEQIATGGEKLYADSVARLEKYLFTRVLDRTRGNQSQAARILGITRGNIRSKIKAFGIPLHGESDEPSEDEAADSESGAVET